jgi:predicted MFS family arabinose efflux permease
VRPPAALVFVNTVVVVRNVLGGAESQVAWALAAFGGGSMLTALVLPKVLDRVADRRVMLSAALAMCIVLVTLSLTWLLSPSSIGWPIVLAGWALLGMSYAGLVTLAADCCDDQRNPPICHSCSQRSSLSPTCG